MRNYRTVAALAGLVSMLAPAVQAAPISNAAAQLRTDLGSSRLATKSASRRCWWRKGVRYCRRYAARRSLDPSGGSEYYQHWADKLPYGSQRWWDQMQRENRAGNPGGGGRD